MSSIAPADAQASQQSSAAIRFHLSLNVANLERSVAFFQAFLGQAVSKLRDDYAKFELENPPLVLSLEPHAASPGGNLNHLGFRLPDSAALVEMQRRLELAGMSTRREEGVECCYARQTKFWVHDPDGNLWEVYTLDDDHLEHRGQGELAATAADDAPADAPALSVWAHRLGEKFPTRLPILDHTVDRINLQGTFNERLERCEQSRRLAELLRVLKPAGEVHLHMLTSNQPLGDQPLRLPGPAAAVQVVPTTAEVLALFVEAGFVDVQLTHLAGSACFHAGDCQLRETRIAAEAPGQATNR
ncbi:ArsI/CadI family heavy metal resistance metalloenzyme [Lignipirellula cremea]|uniref:Cadmium-induced protein CadI n=1 Tax=Lignipirellula cremea TaxID=2528010 RepID=A0A518DLX5_9BACT|nr:ArsI/CadI family heavy metal resistance metalloenzyme [Lignipirellula cremea]QDU92821.1 Cadmium-induced protein CadI [Lignipirellula cremea]